MKIFKSTLFLSLVFSLSFLKGDITGNLKICVLRVSFQFDDKESTTGDGSFLLENNTICDAYTIDPPPHNQSFFESQLKAVDAYYRNVSYEQFGLDLDFSTVFPNGENGSYTLNNTMDYYNPYNQDEIHEERMTFLFYDALQKAYAVDSINFSAYDLIVVFHAGIGQDFELPFLDPTPEDIPSTYVDNEMIWAHIGHNINIDEHTIFHGIILPETQNHLFYEVGETIFSQSENPCDFQYGLTGTFALMLGFAMDFPPLWDVETGASGVGIFALMDQGSNNGRGLVPAPPNPWTRKFAGWESPAQVNPGVNIHLPARSQDQLISLQINDSESFLIENRDNTIHDGISIDSLRYLEWERTEEYPNFIEVLMDSVAIEKDENGVITKIPNYDLGLPASGLLIWHIDDEQIAKGWDDYTINGNREYRGIDLEEADGAQDIGHQSVFMFNDPSSGYFADMWFKGNKEYERANPSFAGLNPEFSSNTFPNTNANDGAMSFLAINNISQASDTMTFSINHPFLMDGFPDTTAMIRLIYDFNQDGINDVFGGKDSIWFAFGEDLSSKIYFHQNTSNSVNINVPTVDIDGFYCEIIESFPDSTIHTKYEYMNEFNLFSLKSTREGQRYSWYDPIIKKWFSFDNESEWNEHKSTIRQINEEIIYKLENQTLTNWDHLSFQFISGIDLNLDASLDVLALDLDGYLYGLNSDFILMNGFPLDFPLQSPILARDLLDDVHPEIIAKSKDGTQLFIFNHEGKVQYQMASKINDKLVCAQVIDGKNAIITQSNIYQFADATESNGNEWAFEHGDWGRSRRVSLDYENQMKSLQTLINAYCYPNPLKNETGTIRIETNDAEKTEMRIYDVAGFLIESKSFDNVQSGNQIHEWLWQTENIESGVYFVNVQVDDLVPKIIKIAVIH